MCGIAGFYARSSDILEKQALNFPALHTRLRHRGPDSAHFWLNAKKNIALLHTRLSIVSQSLCGTQPMTSHSGNSVITFNGEIYNFSALKKELQERGSIFETETDTEVLLAGYEAWGTALLNRLNGEFAFALYDKKKDLFFVARDRFGIKPFYFSLTNDIFSFSSETQFFGDLPWINKQLLADVLPFYYRYLAVPSPWTFFKGIYKLLPGFYITIDRSFSLQCVRWYFLPAAQPQSYADESSVIDYASSLCTHAITLRSHADAKIGIFISGGLDSSFLAARLSMHKKNIPTFHVFFTDAPEYQERHWAQRVATELKTDHHEIPISTNDAFTALQKIIAHTKEPVGDSTSIPLYYAAREAQKTGVKVVLMGEGADEIFYGYTLYKKYSAIDSLYRTSQRYIPAYLRSIFDAKEKINTPFRLSHELREQWAKDKPLFYHSTTIASENQVALLLRQNYTSIFFKDPFLNKFYPDMHTNSATELIDYHRKQLLQAVPHAPLSTEICYLELMYRLPDLILSRTDIVTMMCSLETRVPFLDHHLVEYVWNMPPHYKYKNSILKYILKKIAAPFIPRAVIERPKMGFSSPLDHWFKPNTPFSTYCLDTLYSKGKWTSYCDPHYTQTLVNNHYKGIQKNPYQLWTLCNLFMTIGL